MKKRRRQEVESENLSPTNNLVDNREGKKIRREQFDEASLLHIKEIMGQRGRTASCPSDLFNGAALCIASHLPQKERELCKAISNLLNVDLYRLEEAKSLLSFSKTTPTSACSKL